MVGLFSKFRIHVPATSILILILTGSCLKNKDQGNKLSDSLVSIVVQSGIMTRDSGGELNAEFLNNCIEDRRRSYIKFFCNDLLWPYYFRKFKGKKADYGYFIEDGASVENRAMFRIEGNKVSKVPDAISEMVTLGQVAKWLNKKFQTGKYNVEVLERIAHSHFRIQLPEGDERVVIIKSGMLKDASHAYKAIGAVQWDGQNFRLVDP